MRSLRLVLLGDPPDLQLQARPGSPSDGSSGIAGATSAAVATGTPGASPPPLTPELVRLFPSITELTVACPAALAAGSVCYAFRDWVKYNVWNDNLGYSTWCDALFTMGANDLLDYGPLEHIPAKRCWRDLYLPNTLTLSALLPGAVLTACSGLISLDLPHIVLDDAGCAALRAVPQLKSLTVCDVTHCSVVAAAALPLLECPKSRYGGAED